MDFPSHLKYTKEHEWISFEEGNATIGITDYAIEQLGDIVHIELPAVGTEFEAGDSFGTIESTKTVSDLYMPVGGKVTEVNDTITADLESLGEDPYDGGWLIRMEAETTKSPDLMDAKKYTAFIAEQEG